MKFFFIREKIYQIQILASYEKIDPFKTNFLTIYAIFMDSMREVNDLSELFYWGISKILIASSNKYSFLQAFFSLFLLSSGIYFFKFM